MSRDVAFGGVVFDRDGLLLLRKPKNEYDGYKWTFAKGRPKTGEAPEQTALNEVFEETGVKCEIVGRIPGTFRGGVTDNTYFLMAPTSTGHSFDEETQEIRWVTVEDARKLIAQTVNKAGRVRDLAVLAAAVEQRAAKANEGS